MPTSATSPSDPPIVGTDGDDFLTAETSVSFQWVPAGGNSYTSFDLQPGDPAGIQSTGPGRGSGYVTFKGVASSAPFSSSPTSVTFSYTPGYSFDLSEVPFIDDYSPIWTYDPATGILDPQQMTIFWDDWVGVAFTPTTTGIELGHDGEFATDVETGHWQVVTAIHNVDVFGGGGNDTILGGQGKERLFGGSGDDLIRAGSGDGILSGDAGNDELHGGVGTQILLGGEGNDIIWAGTGTQNVLGGDGRDVIHGGSGSQTLAGGAGNDTIWGGSGVQFLQGSDGSDVLHGGSGDETLSGGAGRDTFVFSTATGHDVITDFRPGQDMISIASEFAALTLTRARDLLPHVSADPQGDAVLTLGSDFRLVLQHVAAQSVEAHAANFFKVS